MAWWYGYYWAGRLFAFFLGYDPFFEYPSIQFVSSVAGGITGSVACGLILWNKNLFPLLVAILATAVVSSQFVQQLKFGVQVDFVATVLGFAVVPLLVILLDFRARKDEEKTD